jgi:transcriptional regulator GlxA family with amidase domain
LSAQTYKQSPAQFFIRMKLAHAKMMLSRGYQPEKVASATGYTNVQSLNRLFEKQYGLSMFQFRKGN